MSTELTAPIQEVTVYSDRALITRRGTIPLEAGEHELRINNLPRLVRDSVRAAGRGPEGMRILNVDITAAFHSLPPEDELLTLRTEVELLDQKLQLLIARQEALKDRQKWLRALGEQSRDFAKGIAQGQMKAEQCGDFFGFMANQALQDAENALSLETQIKQAQQDLHAKQRELNFKQGSHISNDRLAALISLEMAQAGEVELELSYLVLNASWYPQYDVRVQINEAGNAGEVELSYVGMVQQSTGESWNQVKLALSTARPSLAAVLPELKPWYINTYTPPPLQAYAAVGSAAPRMARHKALLSSAAPAAPGSDAFGGAEAEFDEAPLPPPPPVEAEVSTATVEHTGTSLIFRIGRSIDIPSDNTPHKTTIARDNLPCAFDNVSAPALEEQVHLRATITNTTERVLLKGQTSIFLSGEYVGTTEIKQTAPSEEFKIFLGLDDAIKVKRELVERAVDKGNILQSDVRRITYGYRITVHNYAAAQRKIELIDHLPVSQHERIKVKVVNVQPQPAERSKLEILTWKLTLAADAEQQVDYRFVVEHPQGQQIVGLSS